MAEIERDFLTSAHEALMEIVARGRKRSRSPGEHGGIVYFNDLCGLPVQEYWRDMKFRWLHCEAIIAPALACRCTGEPRFAEMHRLVHAWSFRHFRNPEHGGWFGYLHRDGTSLQRAQGNLFRGPFHLPQMLW